MTREEVSEKIKKIILDSVPDRVPEVIEEDTVINNDMAIDRNVNGRNSALSVKLWTSLCFRWRKRTNECFPANRQNPRL